MSWLGGSLSSITGQISNLTKDILTEGTEETTDIGTELRIAQEKSKDLQNVIATLNSENERLKQLNHDLEEKAESSELQINTISQQYRQVLEEKQAEIKELKEEHNELLQHHSTTDYGQHEHTEYSPLSPHGTRDDLDFSDSINMQHEINRLRKECRRLQAQCDQHKSTVKSDVNSSTDDKHQKEIEDLQKKLKEFNEQLATEKESHQHEVVSLQDIHSQKTSVLRKKFKDEILQHKQKITELEESLAGMSDSGDLQQVDIKESAEYLQLEERLKLVELDYNQLKKDHDLVHNELKLAKNKLLDQLDSNHAQCLELLGDLREFRRHMGCEMINRKDKLLEEKQYFIQQIIDSAKQQRELTTEINDLENEQDRVFSEADSMVTDLGNKQQQKSTSEIIDSMEMENMMLQKNNLELQEQIVILQKSVQTLTEEKKQTGSDQTDDNDVSELHQQIASYQEDVQQFDAIKSDLLSEKEALEGILVELRGSLKEKESKLKEVNIELQKQDAEIELLNKEKIQLEESLNESKLELSQTEFVTTTLTMEKEELQKSLDQSKQGLVGNDEGKQLKDELEQKIQELGELSAEKCELETSLEELDSQHQEAMNQVISIRNDLSGKVENLQTKVQELSNTEEKLTEQIENLQSQIQDMTEERDGFIEKVQNQKSELQSLTEERNRLAEKTEGQESQIQNLSELRDQLVDDHQNHDTQVEDMTDTVNRLTEQVQRQETQIREANEANDQLKKVQKEWSDSKSDNEKLVNTLKQEIIEKDEKIVDFEKDVTTLQRENDEKNELLKSLEQMRNELVQLSQKEMDQFVQDVEDKNNIIISLERQIEEKDESIKTVEEKYNFVNEKLQQGSEAETNDFLQRISDLENTLSEKEQFVNTLKSQIHDLTIEKEKVEAVVNQFNEERENCDKKFNEMKEKFNNGEITINNLHMDIKEMKESLSQSVDEINDKTQKIKLLREENNSFQQNLEMVRNENDTLKQTLDSMKNDSEKLTLSEEIIKLKVDLETKTTELTSVSKKCSQMTDLEKETRKQLEDQRKIIDEKEKELNQYKEDILSLNTDIEEFKEEFSIQKKELEERVRDLTTENLSLENNVKHHQDTLDEKEQYYKNIIEELKKGSNLNEAVSGENKNLLKLNVEKDSEMRNLNEEINHLKSLLSEGERLSAISSVDFTAKVQTITDLKQDVDDLSTENELFQTKFQEQKALIEDLENVREKLKAEIKNLTSELENVSAEYNAAMETISKLEEDVKSYQNTIEDQKSGIILLNEKCHGHLQNVKDKESQIVNQEGMLAVFRHASVEKDEQIEFLNKRMKKAVSLIEEDKHHLLEIENVRPNFFLPALEYPEKGSLEQGEKQQEEIIKASSASKLESSEDFDENETRDVLKDIENLQSLLKQKDEVINDLQRNNASLLKMIENKSMTNNDKAVVDIHRLENEVRNLKIEREQIMAVMNEKSREASSLKSEVHRLMNTVAAEKSAIDKLQKDMIQGPGSDEKDDMQKQALQNLSRLVRDKDLEIEALKQKNETLLAVLQDSSSNGSELGALMQDKENLARQLKVFQDERDQMVTFVNQKHEESLKYHQEVQRLTQYINTEAEKHSRIQQEYASLAPQFEDKKQALLKAQNEFINYKQKYTELEVKYGEMIQKVNTSDTIDIASYNAQSEDLKHTQEKLKEMNESLQELEQKVTLLHQQNVEYEEELLKRDAEVSSMKKHIDALTFQLQGVKGELSDLKQEHSLSEKETSEHVSHLQMLKESNNRLTLELQDREFEIKSLKEKMQTLTSVVDGQRDEEGQLKKLLQENESVMAQVKELQQERHQTIMALKQRQIETQELQRECQKLKDKEIKYVKELDRLRAHLLQMEDAYTKDALESEEREKDLRNRLASAEEKLLSSTSAVQTASQNAVQQVESLQQQLYTVASQRDQAYLRLSSLQDQCQQYSVSLSNLQLVLEQFQIGKDSQVSSEVEKYQRENEKLHHSVTELSSELQVVKEKLTEAEDGLEAAARLHQQLDKCDQTISALKEEVQIREASLKNAEVEISDLRNSKDSKVDKMIMKSIVLGYFTAPKNKQDDVLHTIGSVLNFTPSEFDKVMGSKGPVGWMPGFLRFGGNKAVTPPTTPTRRHTMTSGDNPDKSFSELFVRFLETESSPKQPVMRLPAEEMALDVQRHHKPVFNPFTAPRHVNHEERTTRDEHLLMPSSPLSSSLPVFSPVTESSRQKTSSSAILNDVLMSS